jgi:hypothetical protein
MRLTTIGGTAELALLSRLRGRSVDLQERVPFHIWRVHNASPLQSPTVSMATTASGSSNAIRPGVPRLQRIEQRVVEQALLVVARDQLFVAASAYSDMKALVSKLGSELQHALASFILELFFGGKVEGLRRRRNPRHATQDLRMS